MELDDQLAALAAGELDEPTARALRARVASDPALARRLGRFEALHGVLRGWEAPPLAADEVARLEARVDEALADLADGPLTDARAVPLGPRPLADGDRGDRGGTPAPAGTGETDDAGVVDLDAARRRRGLPSWAPAAAVAAVLTAVVGTGLVTGGLGGVQSADTVAGGDAAEEESADQTVESGLGTTSTTSQADGGGEPEALEDDAAGDPGAATAPIARRVTDVDVAEGELLTLLDTDAGDEAAGEGTDEAVTCLDEALERDTDPGEDRTIDLLAEGTYAGQEAVFVIVHVLGEDRFEVLAYDPAGCSLLARDSTTR